jgi:hypothetical protein
VHCELAQNNSPEAASDEEMAMKKKPYGPYFQNFKRKRNSSESEAHKPWQGARLDPFTTLPRQSSSNHRGSASSLPTLQDHSERVQVPQGSVHHMSLQPICKLNNVMMEIVNSIGITKITKITEVLISGSELNVKRAKLQLLHEIEPSASN